MKNTAQGLECVERHIQAKLSAVFILKQSLRAVFSYRMRVSGSIYMIFLRVNFLVVKVYFTTISRQCYAYFYLSYFIKSITLLMALILPCKIPYYNMQTTTV